MYMKSWKRISRRFPDQEFCFCRLRLEAQGYYEEKKYAFQTFHVKNDIEVCKGTYNIIRSLELSCNVYDFYCTCTHIITVDLE